MSCHLPSSPLTWRHWKGKASSWRRSKWGCFALYGDCGTGRQNMIFIVDYVWTRRQRFHGDEQWLQSTTTALVVMEITMYPSGWITLTIQQIAKSKVQVKQLRGAVKLRPFKVEQTSFVVFCNFCPSKFSSPFKMLWSSKENYCPMPFSM